jgi:hypothetical protein
MPPSAGVPYYSERSRGGEEQRRPAGVKLPSRDLKREEDTTWPRPGKESRGNGNAPRSAADVGQAAGPRRPAPALLIQRSGQGRDALPRRPGRRVLCAPKNPSPNARLGRSISFAPLEEDLQCVSSIPYRDLARAISRGIAGRAWPSATLSATGRTMENGLLFRDGPERFSRCRRCGVPRGACRTPEPLRSGAR